MMKSNDITSKSVDGLPTMPASPDPRGAAAYPSPPIGTREHVGDHLERPLPIEGPGGDNLVGGVRHHSHKPKPARFDFAAANQAHLKSMSTMRGKNAGPVKKTPTRR
jgi:hypothetical protein